MSDVEEKDESDVEEENPPTQPETFNGQYAVIFPYESSNNCKIWSMLNLSTDCSSMSTVEQQPEKLPDPSLLSLEGQTSHSEATGYEFYCEFIYCRGIGSVIIFYRRTVRQLLYRTL